MSIFGKKKHTDNTPIPPPAPQTSDKGGLNDIKNEVSGSSGMSNPGVTSPPPMPQPPSAAVSGSAAPVPPSPPGMSSPPSSSPQSQPMGTQANIQNPPSPSQTGGNPRSVLDESLFNLEDFELPDLSDIDSITHQDSNPLQEPTDSSQEGKKEDNSNSPAALNRTNHELSHHNSVVRESLHLGSSMGYSSENNFMPTKGLSHAKQDTYFLTTTEFKHLLELIDAVKDRVKISTQRHMKITSVKAEEDIEYENMKKDFQFIEDKLYEVDSTIFDR